jgi:hypothetical protein
VALNLRGRWLVKHCASRRALFDSDRARNDGLAVLPVFALAEAPALDLERDRTFRSPRSGRHLTRLSWDHISMAVVDYGNVPSTKSTTRKTRLSLQHVPPLRLTFHQRRELAVY